MHITGAILGSKVYEELNDKSRIAKTAIEKIMKYYNADLREVPGDLTDINEKLDFLLHPHGIMRRTVHLEKNWYKDAVGAMLATFKEDGRVVALIPDKISGYGYFDVTLDKLVKITAKNQHIFEVEAIAFYKPFPLKKITVKSLIKYMVELFSVRDFVLFALSVLGVTLLGMLVPVFNNILISDVVQSKNIQTLVSITAFMICASISSLLLTAVKSLLMARITTKVNVPVQAATMARILSLPVNFFRGFSAGELAAISQNTLSICNMLMSSVLSIGFTSLFSLVYIGQIASYAPSLTLTALIIIAITLIFTIMSALVQMRVTRKQLQCSSKESGMAYSLIAGVQKIKLAGAEKRAFARWAKLFSSSVALIYNPPTFLKLNAVISLAITLVGNIVLYYEAVVSGVSVADYYSFNAAYGMLSGAFITLAGIATVVSRIKPAIDIVKPLMENVPETAEDKAVVTNLDGKIEIDRVSFSYGEGMPLVLDDLSLCINPGDYVAIVGRTGCGKSTLVRILLGFEKVSKGAVYYDEKDIDTIDLKSLRRKIGVVMQNGKLLQGDIFSNITISAPGIDLQGAWDAAELAGIKEDIENMPMGMHTVISEGSGGISGGQKQRLMIARAVASKPKILIFDEATSALDNITQKKVSASLDSLNCTRIVIAHRLSTIKNCNRIFYLEDGKIIEQGTYDELMARGAKFYELVERQHLQN